MNAPLVSFCVKSYNQKELLKEALQGAFAQTYRPLEIVISDDGSTDSSWELIKTKSDEFLEKVNRGDVPGGVSVVVNRNEKNLGNLGNWQRICEIAKGELFVKADGDDISVPNRTEEVVKAWVADGKKALVVYHGAIKIDGKGRKFGFCNKSVLDYGPLGAVSSYSRKLFDAFGPIEISDKAAGDDTVYGNRGVILGARPLWIEMPLVRYRVGSGVSSGIRRYRQFMVRGTMAGFAARRQSMLDIDRCKAGLSETVRNALKERFRGEMGKLGTYLDLWGDTAFSKRWSAYKILRRDESSAFQKLILILLLLPRWFCDPILDAMKIFKYYIDLLTCGMRK